ncbi:cobaltochelatase subunit CobN, partial [Agrobacterium tumefaciens]|uniref:cobaltochelatase subunit CobN n=1 Tax=Agrobacterium tumefaciens TaxID=358 RepID=UPI003BA35003
YHPKHPGAFNSREQYATWQQSHHPTDPEAPRIGILFYRSLALGENTAVIDSLIQEVEKQGGMPFPLWRATSMGSLAPFVGTDGAPLIDALILCASQIDYGDHARGGAQARALGVPVLNCTTDHTRDANSWRDDIGGFAPDRSGQLAMSEVSGIIEPMMVGARALSADGNVKHEP